MIKGKIDTVLAQWLREACPPQRNELARRASTSVGYLRLLAGVHRENPKVRLAMAIVEAADEIRGEQDRMRPRFSSELPLISLKDLATPTRHGND